MKITSIETILAGGRYLFLKVHTDEGLVGLGECGAWGYQEATALVVKQMEKLVVGLDPMRIEFIHNALARNLHFRGSVTQSALSGIDIALWDLKGKALGVPCYELLGGKTREKVRIYVNARPPKGSDDIVGAARSLVDQGFTAIRFDIGHPSDENGRCTGGCDPPRPSSWVGPWPHSGLISMRTPSLTTWRLCGLSSRSV